PSSWVLGSDTRTGATSAFVPTAGRSFDCSFVLEDDGFCATAHKPLSKTHKPKMQAGLRELLYCINDLPLELSVCGDIFITGFCSGPRNPLQIRQHSRAERFGIPGFCRAMRDN